MESTKIVAGFADGWLSKLHFWLELESKSLNEAESERYMQELLEIKKEGVKKKLILKRENIPGIWQISHLNIVQLAPSVGEVAVFLISVREA